MVDTAVNRSDTYAEVLRRAREVVKIEDRPDKVLCIFKLKLMDSCYRGLDT